MTRKRDVLALNALARLWHNAVYLVRPDGYVAMAMADADGSAKAVHPYFKKLRILPAGKAQVA